MPISIGIPIYNAEQFLPDAIRSVFAQTYQDWELILLDDGSTDRSLAIARSVVDPRVRVISDGRNLKLAARLNQLVDESKYDLVARMDADDLMFAERLETQLPFFENPAIQIVCSSACTIDDSRNIKALRNNKGPLDVSHLGVSLHLHSLLHPTMLVRKEWYMKNKYDPNYHVSEDLELFLRSTKKGALKTSMVYLIHEPLLFYREGGSQNLKKTMVWNQHLNRAIRTHCTLKEFTLRQLLMIRALWAVRNWTTLLAASLGILPWFKRLRAAPVENRTALEAELKKIVQTPVPGMDEFLDEIPICRSVMFQTRKAA